MTKVKVLNWRYEDGWFENPEWLRGKPGFMEDKEFRKEIQGWHGHVYTDDGEKFEKWMRRNMKGKYDCTFRFNSGNPMITVLIKNDEDATLFKLTWM